MKIAQVTAVFPPRGGIGTVAHEYTESLRRLGHEVDVFTPRYDRPIVKFGNAALMPGLIWRLQGYDVIHLHYPFYGGAMFAALAARIWRIPLVVTYHMKTKAGGWLGLIFKIHRLLVEPFIFLCTKKILVSSRDYAQSVNLLHRKLEELPFGVDTERFSPGTPGSDFTFLFVGGMDAAHYFKGVPIFLQALERLPKDAAWRAVFVGGGEKLAVYKKLAASMGLSDRVMFAGRVSAKDLPGFYRTARVHVLPSIDRSEAFGLVTLEAAASGLPSIVSDLPGVRTLVVPGVTGRLVQPGDEGSLRESLEWMLNHPDETRRMGAEARRRAEERYAQTEIAKQLQSVYESVKVTR